MTSEAMERLKEIAEGDWDETNDDTSCHEEVARLLASAREHINEVRTQLALVNAYEAGYRHGRRGFFGWGWR